ncbi:unnamed protein product [Ostreobium quekettii]|uniref:Uncharacterized protein n=1 Tax=Ostreobium quekettii TaxID=121088 RepID=A0A8S1JC05_9CHLO|nr:unnamed protein product [Ostreobium quekettii]
MATSVEGDSAKAEEAVPPIGGGRSLTLSDFLNELRETGLAEFAADVGLLPTTALEICGSGTIRAPPPPPHA